MVTKEEAKNALDKVIQKSRVHLYKPIQIAEILYHDRVYHDIDLSNLEDYRTKSKKWRDDISIELLGRVCTSSSKFQDNLFEENAVPPFIIEVFSNKHSQLEKALNYCLNATKEEFIVKHFIDSFWNEPGLKRSLDKIYEIIVYALFSTLVETLGLKIEVSIDDSKVQLLTEFEDFAKKVMSLDVDHLSHMQDAKVYRVGVTNAADRGLDMYSNWGSAIQIKHLSLNVELAENIVGSVSSDKVIIVCKDAEKDVIVSVLTQIGWRSHIQSIVTENDLINWYEKALRGQYSEQMGNALLSTLCEEIAMEFPSVDTIPQSLQDRHYEKITDSFWK